MFLACWRVFPPTDPVNGWKAICGWVLMSSLIAATFIDLDHLIIPDRFTIGLGLVGVMLSIVVPQLHVQAPEGRDLMPFTDNLLSGGDAVLGMLIGAGLVVWIAVLGEAALKKEAMGFRRRETGRRDRGVHGVAGRGVFGFRRRDGRPGVGARGRAYPKDFRKELRPGPAHGHRGRPTCRAGLRRAGALRPDARPRGRRAFSLAPSLDRIGGRPNCHHMAITSALSPVPNPIPSGGELH